MQCHLKHGKSRILCIAWTCLKTACAAHKITPLELLLTPKNTMLYYFDAPRFFATDVASRPIGPHPMISTISPSTSNCSMALCDTPKGSSKAISSTPWKFNWKKYPTCLSNLLNTQTSIKSHKWITSFEVCVDIPWKIVESKTHTICQPNILEQEL